MIKFDVHASKQLTQGDRNGTHRRQVARDITLAPILDERDIWLCDRRSLHAWMVLQSVHKGREL